MTFRALLVSKDENAADVLTPVLSGFGVSTACCGYPEGICRVTEEDFDAVIVDFDDPHSAALILTNAQQSNSPNRAVTVALLSDKTKVRNVFGAGANFVLYKPLSTEQAEAGLRATTALIRRERRRSYRVAVQVPMQVQVDDGTPIEGILLDLSEEGLDVLAAQPLYPSAAITTRFMLPDGTMEMNLRGEVAWANPNGQSGVRFVDLPDDLRVALKRWVGANAPGVPPPDPEPISHCKLTDLSLGACYVESESPFPEKSGITLCLKIEDMEVEAEGMVRVMHPGFGMGIEFASKTAEDKAHVANFIGLLSASPGTTPELFVTPRALTAVQNDGTEMDEELEDLLLELLRRHESLTQEEFLQELRNQRHPQEVSSN
jgi:CheY-like chemotaxis protein